LGGKIEGKRARPFGKGLPLVLWAKKLKNSRPRRKKEFIGGSNGGPVIGTTYTTTGNVCGEG